MGFLCNTTFVVADSENFWWKDWMNTIFIPVIKNMLPTGVRQELYRVYDAPVEGGESAQTFSLQWHVESLNDVKVVNTYSEELFKQLKGREEKVLHFSSVMKQIN
ncbi:MAG: DUF4286 family protein [Bacteroidales bacterium]|nr:DUF4286 family protein [Bacteroidales bacterium]